MADHSKPTTSSTYVNFVSELDGRLDDLALGLDPALVTVTNPPTGAIRWSSSLSRWQKWDGTSWGELASTYKLTELATTGNVRIGASAVSANVSLNVNKNLTGGTLAFGVNSEGQIQSDVTVGAYMFRTAPSVASGATVGTLTHYAAAQSTFTGSVDQQFGFTVSSGLLGGTDKNFGFWSGLPLDGTKNWAFYGAGSAPSYFGGNLTLNAGTANGVAYLNGSKVLTTGSALQFDGSNLGLGVTPNTWTSGYKAFEIGTSGSAVWSNGSSNIVLGQGFYANSGNKYAQSSYAVGGYQINAGVHSWLIAGAGTAGNAVTFTQAMTLDASGNLVLKGTSASSAFTIGSSTALGATKADVISVTNYSTTAQYRFMFNHAGTGILGIGSDGVGSMIFGRGSAYDGTVSTEFMRLNSSGNLLLGTTSVPYSLTNGRISAGNTGAGFYAVTLYTTTTSNSVVVGIGNPNGLVGSISTAGTSTSYATSSDYRLKEDIQPMTGALAKVAALKPCTYKWKVDGSEGEGFIAHELQAVVPQCVTGEKDAVDADGKPVYQGIDTSSSWLL